MSLNKLIKQMNQLANTNKLELSIATSMQAVTANRIFTEGKAANGTQIGTYTKSYVKTRQRNNYPSSSKVILQATKQMALDWSVILVGKKVGLGFKNSFNADKSYWVEDTYSKDIFKHTEEEEKLIDELLDKEIDKWLRGL